MDLVYEVGKQILVSNNSTQMIMMEMGQYIQNMGTMLNDTQRGIAILNENVNQKIMGLRDSMMGEVEKYFQKNYEKLDHIYSEEKTIQ